jgi:hypothetical protein
VVSKGLLDEKPASEAPLLARLASARRPFGATLFLSREFSFACCWRDGVLAGTAAFPCFFLKCKSERRS